MSIYVEGYRQYREVAVDFGYVSKQNDIKVAVDEFLDVYPGSVITQVTRLLDEKP